MKILKFAGLTIAGIVLALLVVSQVLPSQWRFRRSIVIAAPPGAMLPLLANLKTGWPQWSAFDAEDPDIQYRYSGPEEGPGATRSWSSRKMGDGEQKIVRADASGVEFDLRMVRNDFAMKGVISFDPAPGGSTRVTWTDSGEIGNHPFYRYMGVFMDRLIGGTFERSLAALKQKVEAAPKK
jgi:hypothetical protein